MIQILQNVKVVNNLLIKKKQTLYYIDPFEKNGKITRCILLLMLAQFMFKNKNKFGINY